MGGVCERNQEPVYGGVKVIRQPLMGGGGGKKTKTPFWGG